MSRRSKLPPIRATRVALLGALLALFALATACRDPAPNPEQDPPDPQTAAPHG